MCTTFNDHTFILNTIISKFNGEQFDKTIYFRISKKMDALLTKSSNQIIDEERKPFILYDMDIVRSFVSTSCHIQHTPTISNIICNIEVISNDSIDYERIATIYSKNINFRDLFKLKEVNLGKRIIVVPSSHVNFGCNMCILNKTFNISYENITLEQFEQLNLDKDLEYKSKDMVIIKDEFNSRLDKYVTFFEYFKDKSVILFDRENLNICNKIETIYRQLHSMTDTPELQDKNSVQQNVNIDLI